MGSWGSGMSSIGLCEVFVESSEVEFLGGKLKDREIGGWRDEGLDV